MWDTITAAAIIVGCILWLASAIGKWAKPEVARHVAAALGEQADDHDEPARADVEAGWVPEVDWAAVRLPSPDASEAEFDDWHRRVIGMWMHPSAERRRAIYAHVQADRIEDEWARLGGGAS